MPLITTRRRRSAMFAAMLALVAGMIPGSVSAGALAPPGECATIMDTADIEEGMTGWGWTVVRGDMPRHFQVEVLGILPDGIAPGRDLIIIEVSDVPGSNFIDKAGGIWAGMSGSPVYIDDKLIGAVAYGFTGAPSPVGGVTPAEDMIDVLDYSSASSSAVTRQPARIRVPAHMRGELAARAGVSEAQAQEFSRLPLPLAVSGLSTRGLQRFQERMDDMGIPVIVTRGSTAPAPTGGPFGTPVPGGNFAGVIAYGNITVSGIGTTTYVCGGQALAFGHPLTFSGRTTLGANDADTLRIVRDSTFGSFKMATIGELFGTVEQDRLAAIRATLGDAPSLIPVMSHVEDLATGNTRNGQSDVTTDEFVPLVSFSHTVGNIDTTIDQVGGGSSRLRWIITGHRANGDPWTLDRVNRFADLFDISFGSADELTGQLFAIEQNKFEDVTFESVEIRAKIDATLKQYDIEKVKISKNGGPYKEHQRLRVQPGDELSMRIKLRQFRGDLDTHTLSLTVPSDAAGFGFLSITGGGDTFSECESDPSACEGTSFLGLLESLENAPRNNDLIADLVFFSESGETATSTTSTSERLDRVIFGSFKIEASVQ